MIHAVTLSRLSHLSYVSLTHLTPLHPHPVPCTPSPLQASLTFPTPVLASLWALRRATLTSNRGSALSFNLCGDSYSGRSTILRYLATTASGPSDDNGAGAGAGGSGGSNDHWSVFLGSTSVAVRPGGCGRMAEGCIRAQSAFRPHLLSCNVPKRGCIYIDDVCLEGTQPGECEAESELVRYALSHREMWALHAPSNADVGGASYYLTTRMLGGGVREPIFSDSHARTRALRALRHTVTVAVASDLHHVLTSLFVTAFQHLNIDVVLDTVSMYSFVLDAFISATGAQPSSELTDEFTYLTHARAPLATVAFIMESLAHSTNTGKPLMPADAIKAAATTLCDYRSLFPGARQVTLHPPCAL